MSYYQLLFDKNGQLTISGSSDMENYESYRDKPWKNKNVKSGVTSMGDNAFYDYKNLTISGKSGSYAETYTKENNIPFRAV